MSEPYNGRTVAFAATPQQPSAPPTDEIRLSEILEEYLAQIERGERPDRDAIIGRHPDLAEQLHACLDGLDLLQQVVPELHDVSGSVPASAPEALGDFRILRELGRGGMGVVYEAEQLSLGRRIALKVLPFAAMLDKQQLARFKNEARAAATLDHPNIVAIYSVGSDRGVHFYAMQLIEGQSLAEIIAEMKCSGPSSVEKAASIEAHIKHPTDDDTDKAALPTLRTQGINSFSTVPSIASREYYRKITQLGIQAAEALDHAHQNGILHRDIKPANLLLDDSGRLWITDFGVARIEADAGMTITGDILGTLRYMAPEQALAKRVVVDQRADIYSLGATLYELLTLQPAFGETDRSELIKQIAYEEPPPLRKLDRQIPAELETIVLKAMAKIPDDRYQTAQQLVDDLQAYIEDRPIKAKPPTFLTRAAKWSRRHVAVVWAAAVVLLISTVVLTVASLLVAKWYHEAKHQRQVASAQLNEAQMQERTASTISKLLVDMLSSTNPDISKGNDYTVRQMLDDFAGRLSANRLADQPEAEAALRATVGNAYCRLGFNDVAEPHLKAALDLKRTALGPNHTDVADSLVDLAWNQVHSNRDQAIGFVQNALQIYRNNDVAPDRMIHALSSLQTFQFWGGNFAEAEAAAREALTIVGDLTSTQVPDAANILTVLAEQYRQQEKYDEAERLARQSVTLHRRLHGERHVETAGGLSTLGRVLYSQEKMTEAEAAFRESIGIGNGRNNGWLLSYLEKILAAKGDQRGLDALRDKEIATARKEVTLFPNNPYSHSNLGEVLIRYGQLEDAAAAYREALRLNPSFVVAHYKLGNTLRRSGQFDDAIHSYQDTIRLDSNNLEAYLALGKLHLKKGNPVEAVSVLQQAVQLKPRNSIVARDLWDAYGTLGNAYYRTGLLEEALSSFKRALDFNPDSTKTLNSLAWCLATTSVDGLRDGKRSIELGQKACALTEYKNPGYLDTLAAAYAEAGDFESAVMWSEKAIGLMTDEKSKEECTKHMEKFNAGKPWRE